MEVTIVLGHRAKEFVTGIPLEELSDILSDVLEQSLEKQVVDVEQKESSSTELLLEKIKEMFNEASFVTQSANNNDVSTTSIDVAKVEKAIKKTIVEFPIELDGDLSMFNFLK